MSTTMETGAPAQSKPSGGGRHFYLFCAGVAAAIVFAGFARTYYLKGLTGAPPLSPLLHLHGMIMSGWVILFITQSWLVSARKVAIHRALGIFGGLLALAMLVAGWFAAINAARLGRSPGPPPLIFLVVPLGDLVVFATLVGAGLWFRGRPAIHRRLMLLSMLAILGAAVARIPLAFIHDGGPLVFFGLVDLVVIGAVAIDTWKNRRLHPAFGWGALFVILSHPVRLILGGTAAWMAFAHWATGS